MRDAVTHWARSFAFGLRWNRSSRSPMIKGMIRIGRRRNTTDEPGSGLQSKQPSVNPKKIAAPPSDGVILVWIRRLPGCAPIFFF